MSHAYYQLLLALVFFVGVTAILKTDLFGYVLIFASIVALMLVVRHYSELYVIGLAVQARTPYPRYFLANSAITVGTAAPLLLLAVAWLFREQLNPYSSSTRPWP